MALTIPAVVTRNQGQLQESDWKSLMEFFKKEDSAQAMVAFCEKKLGIDPATLKKSLEDEEAQLQKDQQDLEQRQKELASKKAASQKSESPDQKENAG